MLPLLFGVSVHLVSCTEDANKETSSKGEADGIDTDIPKPHLPIEQAPWSCGDPSRYQGYDYATVLIGDQCWFAENLRSENYTFGDPIPAGLSDSEWETTSSGSVAVYGAGKSFCYEESPIGDPCDESWSLNTYGRLYNLYAVKDARGLCPTGWHVPTDVEWKVLEKALGMRLEVDDTEYRGTYEGTQMKTTYGWNDRGNGTNSIGFSGLSGGYRGRDGDFLSAGHFGIWWSPSTGDSDAWYRLLSSSDEGIYRNNAYPQVGCSVRCVRDAE